MIELVRSGRSPESLGREFEPSAESIRNRVRQADLDEGRRDDGLTTETSPQRATFHARRVTEVYYMLEARCPLSFHPQLARPLLGKDETISPARKST